MFTKLGDGQTERTLETSAEKKNMACEQNKIKRTKVLNDNKHKVIEKALTTVI